MAKNIEAEGGELVLQNDNGDTIIIPKNKREKALKMLQENDYSGIDELASSLPYMEDYAEDGTLIPDLETAGGSPVDKVSKKEKKEQIELNQQKQVTQSINAGNLVMKDLINKTSAVDLDTPEIKKKSVNMEDIHPSLKTFGDKKVDIPNYTQNINDVRDKVTEWEQEFEDYANTSEVDDEGNYISPYTGGPNPNKHGCLGSTCRTADYFNPETKSYYKIRQDQGIEGVTSSQTDKTNKDYSQLDSWELPAVVEQMGFGKSIFKPNKNFYDYKNEQDFDTDIRKQREDWVKNWDSLPARTIFSTGYSDEGAYEGSLDTYTNKGDKIKVKKKNKEGKYENIEINDPNVRTRHSMSSIGMTEEGDHIIYDYGRVFTVGNSDNAEYTPEDFLNNRGGGVYYATALDEHGGWTKDKMEQAKKHNRLIDSMKEK